MNYSKWKNDLTDYLALGKVIPAKYTYVDDYVNDKLREIVLRQQLRKESIYNWRTTRVIRHVLINVAEDAGLIWKTEELK